ncbi:Formate hydrogenlyase transcriptional activator [compost metagenome]|nr:sigma-54 interaction domain protein [Serratia plymuthica]QPS86760.1 sigma 54-interacting transcriptional regulator [Serratia plymuthica]
MLCCNVLHLIDRFRSFKSETGAFTGASTQRMGRFELVGQGTLFLRAGRNLDRVAATHRDLQQRVADREFRCGLYYRLNVFPILISAENNFRMLLSICMKTRRIIVFRLNV